MDWAPIPQLECGLDLDRISRLFSMFAFPIHPFILFLKTKLQLKALSRSSLTALLSQLIMTGQEWKGGKKNLCPLSLATGEMWQSLKGVSQI